MFSVEALNILLFLTPGLFVVLFLNTFTIRKKESTALDKFAEALVLSLFIYWIHSLFFDSFSGILLDSSLVVSFDNPWSLAFLMGLSFVVALLLTYSKRGDFHMSVMRKIKATKLTSRKTTWQEAFDVYERNVLVELGDGRAFVGYPQFYSDYKEEAILLLDPKSIIKGSYCDMHSKALLITSKADVKMIYFYRTHAEQEEYQNEQEKLRRVE